MKRPLLFGIAAFLLVAIAAIAIFPRLLPEEASFNGTAVEASGPPEEFSLQSAHGDVQLSDFRGEVVVMYFGYTNCPDFCPATLSKLRQVRENLGEDAEDVQVLMISVDPDRDSVERLEQYIGSFDDSFIGLTGSEEALQEVAAQFGIYFQKADGGGASGYTVDHTTTLVVLDREGRQRLFLGYDLTVEQVTSDLENLL